MKKFMVLAVLFVLPIVAYLFFASGINNFGRLPVMTENIGSIQSFEDLDGNPLQLTDKITVLSIYGDSISKMGGNAFNLNEKIYKPYFQFNDFQFVVLAEKGAQAQAKWLLHEIGTTTDTEKWKFAFGSKKAITDFFESLHTDLSLNSHAATPYTFIIDKHRNLRGRDDDGHNGDDLYGYDTGSVAELTNKMTDDVKVILAEYRLALKKYKKNKSS